MKNKLFASFVGMLGLASFSTCAIKCLDSDQDDMVFNRQWVDKIPHEDTELASVFIAIDDGAGVTIAVSQWRQYIDFFLWEKTDEGSIYIIYPQDEKKETVKYKAWECDKPPFELCMEMGGKMYFSRWNWEVETTETSLKIKEY
jgi:hypothetical protein